jgi:hypothetical protein
MVDLSTSIFDEKGSRSWTAVDMAAEKYGVWDYKCFNTSLWARDGRVIDVQHPLVSELVRRRDDYARRKKESWSWSRSRYSGKMKQD